jgi:D-serine deaminase-like pyridoxal phosphate-dependent protein
MDIPDEPLDWRTKGFWLPDAGVNRTALIGTGLFDGAFSWPLLVLHGRAVRANIATMAGFAAAHGFAFAPHAKTAMAPALIAAQLAAGAWGSTVATAHQALVLRRLGVPRVLLANLLLDPAALAWLARETAAGFEAYLQIDSLDGVAAAAGHGPLNVLVELGHAGGRTGARGIDELVAVARAVAAAPQLRLAGVTGYEGGVGGGAAGVSAYLDELALAARAVAPLVAGAVLVSAGGSAWFDLVAARLTASALPPDAVRVLRSGASVTHDDGFYRERTPFTRIHGELHPALAVWAQVLSTPEPGLAIAGMGKRDVSFDEGLPVPVEIRRVDGTREPVGGLRVTRLNDHHCYLEGDQVVRPGGLVRFGISHPCTAFDKWRAVPVIEDDDTISDVAMTYF